MDTNEQDGFIAGTSNLGSTVDVLFDSIGKGLSIYSNFLVNQNQAEMIESNAELEKLRLNTEIQTGAQAAYMSANQKQTLLYGAFGVAAIGAVYLIYKKF